MNYKTLKAFMDAVLHDRRDAKLDHDEERVDRYVAVVDAVHAAYPAMAERWETDDGEGGP